jgi:hypothetical protein
VTSCSLRHKVPSTRLAVPLELFQLLTKHCTVLGDGYGTPSSPSVVPLFSLSSSPC